MKSTTIKLKTEEALELIGMTSYKNRNAKTLSGGETQLVAIARALVTEPEILFLDEPTANLDPISASKIEELISRIIYEHGTTIIMATHDMSQGQRLAKRIAVLMHGEILQTGSAREIFNLPQSKELAEFVGVNNILSGVIKAKDDNLVTINVNGGLIQATSVYTVGEKVHVLIRPEEITLALNKTTTSARNIFEGRIESLLPVGILVRVEVDCGFPLLVVITRMSAEDLGLTIGKKVYLSFKATAIHVIKRWN